jgi:hypothetical protein
VSEQHAYPSRYPPGAHWSSDVAWNILDTLPVGALDDAQRAYLAGLIAGSLMRAAKEGPIAPWSRPPSLASEALSKLPKLR